MFQIWTPSVERLLASFCGKSFKRRGGTAQLCLIASVLGGESDCSARMHTHERIHGREDVRLTRLKHSGKYPYQYIQNEKNSALCLTVVLVYFERFPN